MSDLWCHTWPIIADLSVLDLLDEALESLDAALAEENLRRLSFPTFRRADGYLTATTLVTTTQGDTHVRPPHPGPARRRAADDAGADGAAQAA